MRHSREDACEGRKPNMKIQVNGENWQVEYPATVEQVLARLNPGGGRVAVVVNDCSICAFPALATVVYSRHSG